jgi:LysR family transcriptional regulator, regulator for bpeEF and oprC
MVLSSFAVFLAQGAANVFRPICTIVLTTKWLRCKAITLTNLDDLKVFERVAALESFSAAGRGLKMPKSTVSRCVARLESQLGVRLIQRTTHTVRLTQAGRALKQKCTEILAHLDEALDSVGRFNTTVKGVLKINATIGFSYFALAGTLPTFMDSYPGVEVTIDLTSHPVDLVAGGIDVAVRMGNLPDSRLITTGLGTMQKYLCASPSYLDRRGVPLSVKDLRGHATIETPCRNGMSRIWAFSKVPRDIPSAPLLASSLSAVSLQRWFKAKVTSIRLW